MDKRERLLFGIKSVVSFFLIFVVLNMNPIDQLNIWMQMAIGGLIALIVSDVFNKLSHLFVHEQTE